MTLITQTSAASALVPVLISRRDLDRMSSPPWSRPVAHGLEAVVGRRTPRRVVSSPSGPTVMGVGGVDLLDSPAALEAAAHGDPLEAAVRAWRPLLAVAVLSIASESVVRFRTSFTGQPASCLDAVFLERIFDLLGAPVWFLAPAVDEAIYVRRDGRKLSKVRRLAASRCAEAAEPLSAAV